MKSISIVRIAALLTAAGISAAGTLPPVDTSVRPGDAFYQYVNGAWLQTTEIPADRSSISDAAMLSEQADERTRDIIQETARDKNATADAKKIADFYNAFMDETAIEALGLKSLEPELREIAAIGDRKTLARVLGSQLRADFDALNAYALHAGRSVNVLRKEVDGHWRIRVSSMTVAAS